MARVLHYDDQGMGVNYYLSWRQLTSTEGKQLVATFRVSKALFTLALQMSYTILRHSMNLAVLK